MCELAIAPVSHQPDASHVLEMLRSVGDREAGPICQDLDRSLTLGELLLALAHGAYALETEAKCGCGHGLVIGRDGGYLSAGSRSSQMPNPSAGIAGGPASYAGTPAAAAGHGPR